MSKGKILRMIERQMGKVLNTSVSWNLFDYQGT